MSKVKKSLAWSDKSKVGLPKERGFYAIITEFSHFRSYEILFYPLAAKDAIEKWEKVVLWLKLPEVPEG